MQKGDAGLRAGELVSVANGSLDRADIEKILPHRDPFLFLDSVSEIEAKQRAVGKWLVREDAFFFKGHFPGNPIMPGTLLYRGTLYIGQTRRSAPTIPHRKRGSYLLRNALLPQGDNLPPSLPGYIGQLFIRINSNGGFHLFH